MNKKHGDQIQISPEKKNAEKGKWIHHLPGHLTGRGVIK